MNRKSRRRRGFTLMEVLLVLAILVILGSLVTMAYQNVMGDAEVNSAKTQIRVFEDVAHQYWRTMRVYPSNLQALIEMPAGADATKWRGPYLTKGLPKDPWGNDYRIATPGTHPPAPFDVWSPGPDGADGTADDVGSWQAP
jgi:general secretion pathway protein G